VNELKKTAALLLLALLLCSFVLVGVMGVQASNVKPDIKEARKHAEEMLLPLEGIAGISHREDPPRIIVYLEHEKYKDKVPDSIDGFKTEVVVIGKVKALSLLQLEERIKPSNTYSEPVSRTARVRPIVGGISIGVPESAYGGKMAGTLGLVVQGPENYYYILSCAHVIAMNSKAQFLPLGTAVLQPGTYDGGTTDDEVGVLYRYIKITFGPKGKNYADAAIAKITIDSSDYLVGQVLGSDNQSTYTINGTAEVKVNDSVRKSGRTTDVTNSTVLDTSATVKVWYSSSKWAVFYDQILVNQPFVESGDSGSPVDKEGKFVGLAFAGSSDVAVVCKANYITNGLGVKI
jgi:hypothetical protein